MRNFIAGSLCAIVLTAITIALYLGFGFLEVAADAQPSAWETNLMTPAVHTSVRLRATVQQNPLPDSDATLVAGGKLYMDNCIGCHGGPGHPVSDFGATFFPPATQFMRDGTQY